MFPQLLAQQFVDRLQMLLIADAFPIGRIGDHQAGCTALPDQLLQIAPFYMHESTQASPFDIFDGSTDGGGILVIAA